jgi:RimJ/RimL family protein N-acetyltransferase
VADDSELTLRWRLSERAVQLNRGSTSVEEQRAWIERRPITELNYVIETIDQTAVGMLSLIDIDLVHRRAEAARFLLGDEAATRGLPIAVEAMKLLYQVAFDQLGLARVYGTVIEDNPRMLKWQKYLGMQVEGRLRQHIFIDGHLQDVVIVGILEPEFREIALPRMVGLIALAGTPAHANKEP